MALTATEQTKIVTFLGWPGKVLVTSSTHYDKTVADRMANLDAETEALAVQAVTDIEAVRTKLQSSTSRALVKKVGDIELNTEEHGQLTKEYRRQLKELARLLDIPFRGTSANVGVCI